MTLGTPNTLPNFNCNNIFTIKKSVSEKLLGVIIDNKLDFREHLNTIGKKANLYLHSLNRIYVSVFVKSLFNYCPLVSMLCYLGIMHKIIKFMSGPYVY